MKLRALIALSSMFPLVGAQAQSSNLKYRWIYVMTNLQAKEQVAMIEGLMERGKRAGYTGVVIADSKMDRLGQVPDWYFTDAKQLLASAKRIGMDVIPAIYPIGYASGMLANDVNLVEAMPVKGALFTVHGGQAQLTPDPEPSLKNGDFENVNGNHANGYGFQDGIGLSSFIDTQVKHGGQNSLRFENFKAGNEAGNGRINQQIDVAPWRQYHMSAWIKTENLQGGENRVMALAPDGTGLSFIDIQLKPTQDWTKVDVVFNSQNNTKALAYFGTWGGQSGKIWWDDLRVEETGLTGVVRRPGCPLSVKGEDGTVYAEGQDFETIKDPEMGMKPWPGGYDIWHPSPAIKVIPGSRIKEGQRLRVSFYHTALTLGDQVAICPSEPATDALMVDTAKRVNDLFNPKGFFLSHDEIRVMNWCAACQKRGLTPGQILAANVKRSAEICRATHPGSEIYVWEDMFDPFHNAVDKYYLVNGSLKNSWLGLPKDAIIVNWNSGRAKESLPFFAALGMRQILAGYYDGPVDSIKAWLNEARGLKGVEGVMYTTWVGNYKDLEAFAKAAWGK